MKCLLVKTRPLSDLSKNSRSTPPSVPNRLIGACSSAALAVVALQGRDRCQPSNSRVWQSITSAREAQPSLPVQTRASSAPDPSTSARSELWRRRARPGCGAASRWHVCGRPTSELKDPLHRVLVEAQEPRDGAIAKGGLGLDHRLDRLGKAGIDLRGGLGRRVIDRPPRHPEPGAKRGDRYHDAFRQKALKERPVQFLATVARTSGATMARSSRSMRACSYFRARSSSMASPQASCRSFSCFSHCSRMSSGFAR